MEIMKLISGQTEEQDVCRENILGDAEQTWKTNTVNYQRKRLFEATFQKKPYIGVFRRTIKEKIKLWQTKCKKCNKTSQRSLKNNLQWAFCVNVGGVAYF